MNTCNIDHSLEDVHNKLMAQQSFLPVEIFDGGNALLKQQPTQHTLNELFHLLKKYDLASKEVQAERNEHLKKLVND